MKGWKVNISPAERAGRMLAGTAAAVAGIVLLTAATSIWAGCSKRCSCSPGSTCS